jgi:hypothetical protein
MDDLCATARAHLPRTIDFDVVPLVRQAVSMLRAAAALHLAKSENPGFVPVWSDDGQRLSWRNDRRYLLELTGQSELAVLL